MKLTIHPAPARTLALPRLPQGSSFVSSAYQKGSAPCQWSEQVITQPLDDPGSPQAGGRVLLLSVYKPRVPYLCRGVAIPCNPRKRAWR